jgi:hypothetical protein
MACGGLVPSRHAEGGALVADWVRESNPKTSESEIADAKPTKPNAKSQIVLLRDSLPHDSSTHAPENLDPSPKFIFPAIDFGSLPTQLQMQLPKGWIPLHCGNPVFAFNSLSYKLDTHVILPSPGISGVDLWPAMYGKTTASPPDLQSSPLRQLASSIPADALSFRLPEAVEWTIQQPAKFPFSHSPVTLRLGTDAPLKFVVPAAAPDFLEPIAVSGSPARNPAVLSTASLTGESPEPLAAALRATGDDGDASDSLETPTEPAPSPFGLVSARALADVEKRILRRIVGEPLEPVAPAADSGIDSGTESKTDSGTNSPSKSKRNGTIALDGRNADTTTSRALPTVGTTEWLVQFSEIDLDFPRSASIVGNAENSAMDSTGPRPQKTTRGILLSRMAPNFSGTVVPSSATTLADPDLSIASAGNELIGFDTAADESASGGGSGSGGGGGGGGPIVDNFNPPSPVVRTPFFTSNVSGGLGFMPAPASAFHLTFATPPAGSANSARRKSAAAIVPPASSITLTSVAASAAVGRVASTSSATPAIQTPPTAGQLPAGIHAYNFADLHPILTSWGSSESVAMSGGRMGGSVTSFPDPTTFATSTHAAIWNVSMSGFVDMQPSTAIGTSFPNTQIIAVRGQQSVGVGSGPRVDHALLWVNANPDSAIDLNPSTFKSSYAEATTGTQQVGYGYPSLTPDSTHALLWNSSALSFVDLNPVGESFSFAYGADGNHQVGFGQDSSFNLHALLWSGSALGVTDVHPTSGAFVDSRAMTISGTRAGGYGTSSITYFQHAILWTSLSAASGIDITPALYDSAQVNAINAFAAVGSGALHNDYSGNTHALLWNANGTGYVDLNGYLPSNIISAEADAIDASGNITGFALDGVTQKIHAVEWLVAVPEPGALSTLAGVALAVFHRPRKRRNREG